VGEVMSHFSRRDFLVIGTGVIAGGMGPLSANGWASTPAERHGLSAFGELGYPPAFTHVAYADPAAPKGGRFSQLAGAGTHTFNSLNGFILKGSPALDMQLVFASLMARAYDEPDSVYGLAAESVAISPDRRVYHFRLRKGIKFHDGTRITAADVAFSLSTLKAKGHPAIGASLQDMDAAEVVDDENVVIRFSRPPGRDVPSIVATLPIFSKAYYASREFGETTMEPPLGSGPYRVGQFEQGRFLELERVHDWWGIDLPIVRGQHNFDVLRYEYFRDRETAFEGFTAKAYTFREEYTSRIWATRYDFPAVRDGQVKRETIPDGRPAGAQGWMINTRLEKFRDARLREALTFAFDFAWVNKQLMYGLYKRTSSYFQNSDMEAKGKPSQQELALLAPFRGKVPEDVFGEAWVPPVSDGSGHDRQMLRKAGALLKSAGWTVVDGRRVNSKGEQLSVQFLIFEKVSEPHHALYIKNLSALGIAATVQLVDFPQYRSRMQNFDFEIAIHRYMFPLTPGNTLENCFSSHAAGAKGSFNVAGIADPVVDALIEKAIIASDRNSLNTACRALDRVLRAGHYWVPHWYKPVHWIAYWDLFGHPATKPRYARGIPETWWYDGNKSK